MGEFVNKGKEPDQTSSALVDSAPGYQDSILAPKYQMVSPP